MLGHSLGMEMPLFHFKTMMGKNNQRNKKHPLAVNYSPLANFHALKIKRRGNKS